MAEIPPSLFPRALRLLPFRLLLADILWGNIAVSDLSRHCRIGWSIVLLLVCTVLLVTPFTVLYLLEV